jgi:hypothetical protein
VQVEPTDERLSLVAEDLAASSAADLVNGELSTIRRELTAHAQEIDRLKAKLETLERSLWIRRWHSVD